VNGVEHREKVGRRGDAIKLYGLRKGDVVRGVKMPANTKHKGVKFAAIAQEAIDWYINHERRDVRNFKGRMKFILEALGDRVADEIKPSEIDTWIGAHAWTPATKNRYKNVFGKTFKIALADGKLAKPCAKSRLCATPRRIPSTNSHIQATQPAKTPLPPPQKPFRSPQSSTGEKCGVEPAPIPWILCTG
jgi:hypothetical protein